MPRSPYPLQWPDDWPRTRPEFREQSQFHSWSHGAYGKQRSQLSLFETCEEAMRQIELLGAANKVITSDLPVKANGMPYANGRASDPGIAIWWVMSGHEQVMACDRYVTHAENVRAISKTIEAMRGIERWGSSAIVQRAFAGFAALPAAGETSTGQTSAPEPPPPEPTRAWMQYFHVSEAASRGSVKTMYRTFAKALHPDKQNGDAAAMAALNAAWDQATAWFDWRDKITGLNTSEED